MLSPEAAGDAAAGKDDSTRQSAPTASENPTLKDELLVLNYASTKLRLLFELQRQGLKKNVPLPSPTFISDLKSTLEGFEQSIRWVSAYMLLFAPACLLFSFCSHS